MTTDRTPLPPLDSVKGWFAPVDQLLFTWFLERQARKSTRGDLVELGAYLGKSAILIGHHRAPDETFTVCDLFGSDAPDADNQLEVSISYASLTRKAFESNYLRFHAELPKVLQAPTSVILDHVSPGSCRFVHVDASHLYAHVQADIAAAKTVLVTDGIVVCDDYRTEHTPGVAAAVWEAVLNRGLQPICLTRQKLYGSWSGATEIQEDLLEWLSGRTDLWHEVQTIADRPVVRIKATATPPGPSAQDAERSRLEQQLTASDQARRSLKRQLAAVSGSRSYRIGRLLTSPVRALRRVWRRMRGG